MDPEVFDITDVPPDPQALDAAGHRDNGADEAAQ
jgi:hypothetical protein